MVNSRGLRTLLPLVAFATACVDTPQIAGPAAGQELRPFATLASARFADFVPLTWSATCSPGPTSEAELATYQPFVLPEGYSQTIVTTELDPGLANQGAGVNNFDMLTLNENGPQAGRYLYRTHEVGSNGSVSETDLVTGVTRIVANESHYEALDGIVWTPWGTVLFAEERIVASLKDPAVPNAVGGLVYEYSPATGTARPLP